MRRLRQRFCILFLAAIVVGAGGLTAIAWLAPAVVTDHAVSSALRRLLLNPGLVGHLRSSYRAAIIEFYRRRGFTPVWFADGVENSRATSVIGLLEKADDEGLNADEFVHRAASPVGPAAIAAEELRLTAAILGYAHQMSEGRVRFADINPNIFYAAKPLDSLDTLEAVASANDSASVLRRLTPPHPAYRALKEKLQELRGGSGGSERQHAMDVIAANMERWRWMPRDLGHDHVVVNIPDYTLELVHRDVVVWSTRVVVGDPRTPTPLMSASITSITFNPTWNVPQSIIATDYLNAVDGAPDELERIGVQVVRDPQGQLHLYQLPGDQNALGRLRFNFPNRFAVYQHDTPLGFLFEKEMRAFSRGCMRVEDPIAYAQILLRTASPSQSIDADRIRGLLRSDEITIEFETAIPVHLTYQTAWVDAAGSLVTRPDVYGYDSKILAELRRHRRGMTITQAQPATWRALLARIKIAGRRLLLAEHSTRHLAVQ